MRGNLYASIYGNVLSHSGIVLLQSSQSQYLTPTV